VCITATCCYRCFTCVSCVSVMCKNSWTNWDVFFGTGWCGPIVWYRSLDGSLDHPMGSVTLRGHEPGIPCTMDSSNLHSHRRPQHDATDIMQQLSSIHGRRVHPQLRGVTRWDYCRCAVVVQLYCVHHMWLAVQPFAKLLLTFIMQQNAVWEYAFECFDHSFCQNHVK